MRKGILAAVAAYSLWGLFPIYWKWLEAVPALEILSHRITWSLILLTAILAIKHDKRWLRALSRNPKTLLLSGLAGVLLATNWLTYIWAVNSGFIVESSLGYFINPLVNVLLGVIIFRENLRSWQKVSVGLASIGVIYLTAQYGSLPWIALTLAFSFGMYGVLKKISGLNQTRGLAVETAFLFLPASAYLIFLQTEGSGAFMHISPVVTGLLILSGPVTVIPLLLFATAVRSIPLSTVGLLQYLAPTGQFLIGVLVYHEAFTHVRMVGYSLIWSALVIFTLDGFLASRKSIPSSYAG